MSAELDQDTGADRPPGALGAGPGPLHQSSDHLIKAAIASKLGFREAARIGRFRVLHKIGAGAMGAVYAAYDDQLARKVAIKIVRTEAKSDQYRARFLREARAMARLSHHPNIVTAHQVGTWQGKPFIAMEHIDGTTLDRWRKENAPPWKDILRVLIAAGRGLAAAHRAGLVHRDFKPGNVLVDRDGQTRVADFGLVGTCDDLAPEITPSSPQAAARLDSSLTATGALLGTPAYMAPEQFAPPTHGERPDQRADQFSFCVTAYEAIFGHRPFAGDDAAAVMANIRAGNIEAPSQSGSGPRKLYAVLRRGLQANRDERWPSMDALLAQLHRIAQPRRRSILTFAGILAAVIAMAAWLHSQAEVGQVAEELAHQRQQARDMALVAAARALEPTDPTAAAAALAEVEYPDRVPGWQTMASSVLHQSLSTAIVRGGGARARAIELRSNGNALITWSLDGIGQFWDLATGQRSRKLESPAKSVSGAPHLWSISSPDGRLLLAGFFNQGALLYDLTGTSSPRSIGGSGPDRIMAAAFEPDKGTVIALAGDSSIRRYRVSSADSFERLAVVPGPVETLSHGGFRPDRQELYICRQSGAVEIWALDDLRAPRSPPGDCRELFAMTRDFRYWVQASRSSPNITIARTDGVGQPIELRGHAKGITSAVFDAAGRYLATASYDGTARVWRGDGSEELLVLRGHDGAVSSVVFSPDASHLVTTSYDRTARLWHLPTGRLVRVLRGHGHHVNTAVFSSDGSKLATSSADGTTRVWALEPPDVVTLPGSHTRAIWSASLDHDREQIATASHDGTARVWSADPQRPMPPRIFGTVGASKLYSATFSRDGSQLVTGHSDGKARVWRLDRPGDHPVEPIELDGHHGWVYTAVFNSAGDRVITGSRGGEVRLWRVGQENGHFLRELGRHSSAWSDGRIHSIDIRPDGSAAASAASDGVVRIWSLDRDAAPVALAGHADRAYARYSPDNRRLVTAGGDGLLHLWTADGSTRLATFSGHEDIAHHVDFSPSCASGNGPCLMVSSSLDHTARVWNLDEPSRPPLVLYSHDDFVVDAHFDPQDPRRLVTASYDRSARVWNLDDWHNPIILRGHQGKLRFADFTARGDVITASFDGTVKIWTLHGDTSTTSLQHRLRRATRACLTANQRIRYLAEDVAVARRRLEECQSRAQQRH